MTRDEFSEHEINAALLRVEAAKARHPEKNGGELAEFGLRPSSFQGYALTIGKGAVRRLAGETRAIVYAAGWLNGLMVGVSLADATKAQVDAAYQAGFDAGRDLKL